MPAWIPLDGAVNARTVVPGVLLRTDNLQDLSEADVRTLVEEHGVEVVIDLRTTGERDAEGPAPLDADPRVRVEHRSLYPESGGNTDLDMSEYHSAAGVNPGRVDTGLERDREELTERHGTPQGILGAVYARYLERRPGSILAAIRAIADTDGAVLVHCAAGKDRTGTVVAVALEAAGHPREAIVDDYVATAERIEAIVARLVASETYRPELEGHDPADHAPHPDTMRTLLATLDERHGGVAGWLEANGLTADELARLRTRLASEGPHAGSASTPSRPPRTSGSARRWRARRIRDQPPRRARGGCSAGRGSATPIRTTKPSASERHRQNCEGARRARGRPSRWSPSAAARA